MPRLPVVMITTFCFFYAITESTFAQNPPDRLPRSGLIAGATLFIVTPFSENDTAFISTNAGFTSQTASPFEWDLEPMGSIWFGWQFDNGIGVRKGFTYFDNSSQRSLVNNTTGTVTAPASLDLPGANSGGFDFGSPGVVLSALGVGVDRLKFVSRLGIYIGDYEATYDLQTGPLYLTLTGGGRYVQLKQNYSGTLLNSTPGQASETQELNYENRFRGIGPTFGAQARWNFNDGWAVVGMLRGSLLVGETKQTTAFRQVVNDVGNIGVGDQNINVNVSARSTAVLPMAEFELGLEYGVNVGSSRYAFRGGLVNQTYFNAGNASNQDGNLSLFGFQLSAGVNY